MMKSATTFGILGIFALGNPSLASTNLVTNGGFESSSPINAAAFPTSAGGIGQVSEIVNLPGWARTTIKNGESGGFAFVVDAAADNNNLGPYPNQGGGFPSKFSPGASSNLFLWGPDFGPNPQSNGFSASPSGGNFMAIAGDYGQSKIFQTITGLNTARSYSLSFEYAGSQLTGESGDTFQEWRVGLNGSAFTTVGPWINPSRGFTSWQTFTTTFTPTTSSIDLSFEAYGSAVSSGLLDPMLLLDNVQLSENTPPPSVPGPLPAAGAAAAFAWSRRLRRRLRGHN